MKSMVAIAKMLDASLEGAHPDVLVRIVGGPLAGQHFVLSATGEVRLGTMPEGFPVGEYPLKKVFAVGEHEYYAQAAEKDPHVLVLGAGHVSRKISDILLFIGCEVTVVDDREEFLRPDFFQPAVERVCLPFDQLRTLPLDRYSGVIIVTRAHEFDSVCLHQLRDHLGLYTGIMGSKKRIYHAFEALRAQGWSQEELDKLYAPIGLDIGADTPEEIALSIVSEYLAVVRGKWPVQALKQREYKN